MRKREIEGERVSSTPPRHSNHPNGSTKDQGTKAKPKKKEQLARVPRRVDHVCYSEGREKIKMNA